MTMQHTPARYVMRRNKHKQGKFVWQGEKIKVDDGIQPLLTALNYLAGIATVASCIGDAKEMGYVYFVGDSERLIRDVVRRFRRHLPTATSIDLELRPDNPGAVIRWPYEFFPLVVEAAEAMLPRLKNETGTIPAPTLSPDTVIHV